MAKAGSGKKKMEAVRKKRRNATKSSLKMSLKPGVSFMKSLKKIFK